MQEGPIKEASYYYPALQIKSFLDSLPATEAIENIYINQIDEKILVMTHDDEFDQDIYSIEEELGVKSTWFLLSGQLDVDIPCDIDVHIHFNKESGILSEQIAMFKKGLVLNLNLIEIIVSFGEQTTLISHFWQ